MSGRGGRHGEMGEPQAGGGGGEGGALGLVPEPEVNRIRCLAPLPSQPGGSRNDIKQGGPGCPLSVPGLSVGPTELDGAPGPGAGAGWRETAPGLLLGSTGSRVGPGVSCPLLEAWKRRPGMRTLGLRGPGPQLPLPGVSLRTKVVHISHIPSPSKKQESERGSKFPQVTQHNRLLPENLSPWGAGVRCRGHSHLDTPETFSSLICKVGIQVF